MIGQATSGKFFCPFFMYPNNPGAVSVLGKRLHTKTPLSVGKGYLPIGKMASVTTTNTELADLVFWRRSSIWSSGLPLSHSKKSTDLKPGQQELQRGSLNEI